MRDLAIYSISFALIIALSNCSPPNSGYFTTYVSAFGVESQCLKLVETRGLFKNGSGEIKVFSKKLADSESILSDDFLEIDNLENQNQNTLNSIQNFDVGWNSDNFRAQSDPDSCWAATLQMAFLHQNWRKYDQSHFLRINREHCGFVSTRSATLNQIIFSLTKVHTDRGIWIGDPGGQFKDSADNQAISLASRQTAKLLGLGRYPPALPNFSPVLGGFMPVEWSRKIDNNHADHGGVYPIYNTQGLMDAIINKKSVIVGVNLEGRSHVIMITKIRVRPSGVKVGSAIYPIGGMPKVESVVYIDPQSNNSESEMKADYLFDNARFIFRLDV